jgi:hypothetical protein
MNDRKLLDDKILQAEIFTQAPDQRRELNADRNPCPELWTNTYGFDLQISWKFRSPLLEA